MASEKARAERASDNSGIHPVVRGIALAATVCMPFGLVGFAISRDAYARSLRECVPSETTYGLSPGSEVGLGHVYHSRLKPDGRDVVLRNSGGELYADMDHYPSFSELNGTALEDSYGRSVTLPLVGGDVLHVGQQAIRLIVTVGRDQELAGTYQVNVLQACVLPPETQ